MKSCIIDNPLKLAQIMAKNAKAINAILTEESEKSCSIELTALFDEFQDKFGNGESSFADFCAQFIVFGLFVVFAECKNDEKFFCEEALKALSKFHPFLEKLFNFILENEEGKRIKHVIDEIAHVFSLADRRTVLDNLRKENSKSDSIFNFYEIFFCVYDNRRRRAMGVWYTPQPVVDFMIRAVDEILRVEFQISEGLADASKTKDGWHSVQILDPAAGSGTFLIGVIDQIYREYSRESGKKAWDSYVSDDLLPRIAGFEISAIPYMLAHLRIAAGLGESGYCLASWDSLPMRLINSLEVSNDEIWKHGNYRERYSGDDYIGESAISREQLE